ncbi:hypothetical protein SUDANB105_07012 [Streptomyces sp. enrichment culture]|uniref:hypothetical protein n=1 Tax=Streptomyces sp. enrichment culture TaxID=1795815 RepID=UPI003F572199
MIHKQTTAAAGQRHARTDLATVLLLQLGALFLAVGWLFGVLLLWTSDTWRLRDKVLGTVVIPGGLALPIYLTSSFDRCTMATSEHALPAEQCGRLSDVPWLETAPLVLLWAASLASAFWLIHTARRPEEGYRRPSFA